MNSKRMVKKKFIDLSGWWFQPTPLKNDGVKVSWDDDIPIYHGKITFMFQSTNQYNLK